MEKSISPLLLRTFRRAYELGNFTQTAKALGMTQSGVSQHVAGLEQVLGRPLFDRIGRNIRPTTVGTRLYASAGSWLSQMEDIVDEIRTGEADQLKGSLVFGAPGSFAHSILPELTSWKAQHPDIFLNLIYGPNSVMEEEVRSGRMDLGVTTDPLDAKEFVSEELFEQEYVLVSHPKAQVKLDSWEAFCENTFIDYPGSESIFQKWIGTHYRKGLGKSHRLNFKYKVNNMEANLFLLQQNAGITIYPSEPLKKLLHERKLKVHSKGKTVSNQIYLVYRQGQSLSKRAAGLREVIISSADAL